MKILTALRSPYPLFGRTVSRDLLVGLTAVSFIVSIVTFPIVAKPCTLSDAETRSNIGVSVSNTLITPNTYKIMILTLRHDLRARDRHDGHFSTDTQSYNDIASELPASLLKSNHLPLNVSQNI